MFAQNAQCLAMIIVFVSKWCTTSIFCSPVVKFCMWRDTHVCPMRWKIQKKNIFVFALILMMCCTPFSDIHSCLQNVCHQCWPSALFVYASMAANLLIIKNLYYLHLMMTAASHQLQRVRRIQRIFGPLWQVDVSHTSNGYSVNIDKTFQIFNI